MQGGQQPRVIIDPGHGGTAAYGGSSASGVEPERGLAEKHVNLELARRVAARLGNQALMTRDRDINVPLSERARMASQYGAGALISIHANAGDSTAHGSEVWLHDRHDRGSIELGQAIYAELGRVGPTHGMYQGPLAVLDPRELGGVPACLIETDYLSHPLGRQRLTSGAELDRLADAISSGVRSFLGHGYGRRTRSLGSDDASFDYEVPGVIPEIRQPTGMSCWATVTTMLMSWRDSQTWDIEAAMDSIGSTWGDLFRLSRQGGGQGGLRGSDKPAFLTAAGLVAEAPTGFTGMGWADLMRRYGPLWVTADVDPSQNFAIHARIMYRIHGDGSLDGTRVHLVDPGDGRRHELSLRDFVAQYEAEALDPSRPLRVQVVHWPESVARTVLAGGQGYGNQSFEYTVPNDVPEIRQPTGMSCWATVTTMLMSWRDSQTWDIEAAMDSVGREWGDLFRLSRQGGGQGGLSGADKPRFLSAAGLVAEGPAGFSGMGWADLMRRYGPLWVTADVDPSENFAIHARIMYHIHGDGSLDGTRVGLVDPGDGRRHELSLRDFVAQYEAEAIDPSRPLRVQVVHWPESVARTVMAGGQGYGRAYGRALHHHGRARSYGDNYFTDTEQLDAMLRDHRATDTERVSSVSDAQALVDAYLARGASTVWTGINARTAASEIRARCANHRLFQQGNLNLCGPASFLMMWAGRDPVGYARYALGLLESGRGSIGSRTVTASDSMRRLNYPRLGSPYDYGSNPSTTMSTPAADFIAMAALRNDANAILPYDGRRANEQLAGLTTPEEFAGWLRDTGIYSSVREEANWTRVAGWDHATGLLSANGVDTALLINVNALARAARVETIAGSQTTNPVTPDNTFILNQFPNHFVVMLAEIIPDYGNNARTLSLSAWTWGGSYVFEGVPSRAFMDNYYGAVIAHVRRS